MRHRISYFYKIFCCIQSSKTLEQIKTCEQMINNCKGMLALEYLADLALIKKVELMSQQYQEESL